jgi:hypothetical protein
MSLTPVECQGDAHPLLLRGHQLQSEVVVYGDLDILFGAEITLGGLDGRVPEQKLDLFQAVAILPAELGPGAAQIVRPEPLDPDLFGALLDRRPDGPATRALFDLPPFDTARSSLPSSTPAAVIQALIPCFTHTGMATVPF